MDEELRERMAWESLVTGGVIRDMVIDGEVVDVMEMEMIEMIEMKRQLKDTIEDI